MTSPTGAIGVLAPLAHPPHPGGLTKQSTSSPVPLHS